MGSDANLDPDPWQALDLEMNDLGESLDQVVGDVLRVFRIHIGNSARDAIDVVVLLHLVDVVFLDAVIKQSETKANPTCSVASKRMEKGQVGERSVVLSALPF